MIAFINRIRTGLIRLTQVMPLGQHLVVTNFETHATRNIPYRIRRFRSELRPNLHAIRIRIARFLANTFLQMIHIVRQVLMIILQGLLHIFGRQVLRRKADLVAFQNRIAQLQMIVTHIENGGIVSFKVGSL